MFVKLPPVAPYWETYLFMFESSELEPLCKSELEDLKDNSEIPGDAAVDDLEDFADPISLDLDPSTIKVEEPVTPKGNLALLTSKLPKKSQCYVLESFN